MPTFIPASEIKNKYAVLGHFYSIQLPANEVVECRSVLEIIKKERTPAVHDLVSALKPDAIFVMMNPGSSRPLVEVENPIHFKDMGALPISLVPTKPDTTQYQVMRLMEYRNWHHVRVLNLSDLRCSKSPEFIRKFRDLEDRVEFQCHSIFSITRQIELSLKLTNRKNIPIVCAWGISDKLDPLITRCQSSLGKRKSIIGLLKEPSTNKYFHPLPTLQRDKLRWLEGMMGCFGDVKR